MKWKHGENVRLGGEVGIFSAFSGRAIFIGIDPVSGNHPELVQASEEEWLECQRLHLKTAWKNLEEWERKRFHAPR